MSLRQGSGSSDQPKKNYFAEIWAELKKANWPTQQEGRKMTWIVLVVITIFTAWLFALGRVFDFIFSLLIPHKG